MMAVADHGLMFENQQESGAGQGITESEKNRKMLAAEQHKRQEMEIELGAQRQVNEDIMQQLHDQISLNHHLRCQLSEERRQHELTNLKLETAANAAADIYDGRPDSFENMQVEELSQLCRQLDLCWKEEQKRNRALLDEVHRCNEEALHMKDELSRIKSDKTTRKDEQASSNNSKISTHFSARDSHTKTKLKTSVPHAANSAQPPPQCSSEGSSNNSRTSASGSRDGANTSARFPMEQLKIMEQTLGMVRYELKRVMLERETLNEEKNILKDELVIVRNELKEALLGKDASNVDKHERGVLTKEKDKTAKTISTQEVFYQSSLPKDTCESKDADGSEKDRNHVPAGELVDIEDYRTLCAKFGHLSNVLEREQLRREALETHLLDLQKKGRNDQSESEICLERELEIDRERETTQMCITEAKAAVLTARAECGRLRADLNHSLDCFRGAEESKLLLERALIDQHQRYQRLCDRLNVLQGDEKLNKLKSSLEQISQNPARGSAIQERSINLSRQSASNAVRRPVSGSNEGRTGRTNETCGDSAKEEAKGRGGGGGAGQIDRERRLSGALVEFDLHSTRSPMMNGDNIGINSTLFRSPSPSCVPTPPYTSDRAMSRMVNPLTPTPSPAPNTIFYTTSATDIQTHHTSSNAITSNTNTRGHSRLSADPTVPSLSLPEEIKDNPDGIEYAKEQIHLRDSISTSISKARQSSLPPRAGRTGKVEASEGSSSTESSRHEEGADTKNATLRIMRGVKLLHRARGELGQGETSSSGDGRTTEARLGARWGKGLHESSRSEADLRVPTRSSDTPAATPAHVRTSPTVNMGVLQRSMMANGMDFRAPLESPHWHFLQSTHRGSEKNQKD